MENLELFPFHILLILVSPKDSLLHSRFRGNVRICMFGFELTHDLGYKTCCFPPWSPVFGLLFDAYSIIVSWPSTFGRVYNKYKTSIKINRIILYSSYTAVTIIVQLWHCKTFKIIPFLKLFLNSKSSLYMQKNCGVLLQNPGCICSCKSRDNHILWAKYLKNSS